MSRSDQARLEDILIAIDAIFAYVGPEGLARGVVFDAVRMRLVEIGEAIKDISPSIRTTEPTIDWTGLAGMRDILTYRFFDAAMSEVDWAIAHDLAPLRQAVERHLKVTENGGANLNAPPITATST